MPQGGKESDFRIESCPLLGYYAASSGNNFATFRGNQSVPSSGVNNLGFLTLDDGTDRLSRNVGKYLSLLAALTVKKRAILI
jgi:hypothetical protein